jgi:protein FAM32A
MPSSDYASAVSGGLKLKGGAKDAGIKKKSKKSRSSKEKAPKSPAPEEVAGPGASEDKTLALSNPSSDPERDTTPSAAGTGTGTGKTEAQRRHEEIKRKRVRTRPRSVQFPKRYQTGFTKP